MDMHTDFDLSTCHGHEDMSISGTTHTDNLDGRDHVYDYHEGS